MKVVSGQPSYINLLDALNGWQLVRDASIALGKAAAASFKHVSPAGAAAAGVLDQVMEQTWDVRGSELTPAASAYPRARDCDPKSSFGDMVAVSDPVDRSLAEVLQGVVSDGIVAPGFEPGAVEMLAKKKRGEFLIVEIDSNWDPPEWEAREVFGVRLEQQSARAPISAETIRFGVPGDVSEQAVSDLLLAMITARYTQSNSVAYAKDGIVLGVGAGQQSRVDCTKLAGTKVDTWWLRRHEKVRSIAFKEDVRRQDRINWRIRYIEGDMTESERTRFIDAVEADPAALSANERRSWLAQLDELALASDGYIPFRDNIDQAALHGVRYLVQPGGSARNDEVAAACQEHQITVVSSGIRLFHH
jgi:phosphoribosylaminoimidazolecarboxamide formyltransferase/IMP cyclohydrolase